MNRFRRKTDTITKAGSGRFYKNRRQKFHPSYELSSDDQKWHNMTLTHNPNKKESYIELDKNPNPNDSRKAFLRKYVSHDPIKTRGEEVKSYHLSEADQIKIDRYLREREESKRLDKERREKASQKSKQKKGK